MRVNMGREGRTSSSLSANGGSMLGALILANGPTQPLEAATKYYVDSTFANLNANNILDGVLPISSLPGFTGDATSPQGSNVITLANLGVTPGSYAKIIVDTKGRVTGNDILTESDIPTISWEKVQNKPNTLEGYGITNALSITGGVFGGQMSVVSPTNSLSSVSKQYVDSALSGNSAVVGDIIRKPFASTPSGFLRCNGGMVDKVIYADLYSVIGDNFNKYTMAGSGRPWQQQYEINSDQSGDLTGWAAYGNLPEILHSAMFAVTKNRVYKFGGASTNNGYFTSVYYAPINADGSLGAWANGINLPTYILSASIIVLKDKLYIIGGSGPSGPLTSVYMAPINVDGSLGNWSLFNNLPTAIAACGSFVTKNRVYLLGGYNSSSIPMANVYYAPINSDGTIGNWVADTALPSACAGASLFVTKNRVYLCGGIGATSNILATVYTTVINNDGTLGTWSTSTALPVATYNAQYFATKTRAYIIGGFTGANRTAAVYTATINQDGTLGSWGAVSSLPYAVSNAHSFIVKNKIYLLGGGGNADWLSVIYSCPVYGGKNDYSEYYSISGTNYLMPGSGKPWQQQYQINTTQTNNIDNWSSAGSLPEVLYHSHVLVTKNRIYLCGGWNATTAISTVYTAPINADGTLGNWTTSVSLPTPVSQGQLVVTKNHVHLLGGHNGTSLSSIVYTTVINSDGTLGAWLTGNSLPVAISLAQAVVTKNRVYLLGGNTGTSNPNIYYAMINADGTLGTWLLDSKTLPGNLRWSQAVVTNNRVYLLGSHENSNIYTASINNDGEIGVWSVASNSLPVAVGQAQVFVVKDKIYIVGGWTGSVYVSTVYYATIDAYGVIGAWYTGTSLPSILGRSQLAATKNHIYMLGGYTTGNGIANIVSATISDSLNDYSAYYDGTVEVVNYPNYMMPGSGRPWDQQYQINTTQSSDITGWTTGTSLPTTLASGQVAVTKNTVYLLGGFTGTAYISSVYMAPINADGTLGAWVSTTSLPGRVGYPSCIVTKNRIHVIGGYNNSSVISTVYTAPINTDGSLGAWTTGTSMPGASYIAVAAVTKNRVYMIGGGSYAGGYMSTVYTAPINADGTLGSWATSTSLPGNLAYSSIAITKNRIYLLGGHNGSAIVSTVYTAEIGSDGIIGQWSTGTSLPGPVWSASTIVTGNRIYMIGGHNGGGYISSVYTAPINSDGTLGVWTTGTSIPAALGISLPIITKNRVYLLGGNNGGYVSTVYTATISSDVNNDYSSYYDGTILPIVSPIDTNLFALPDFSSREKNGINLYIKY